MSGYIWYLNAHRLGPYRWQRADAIDVLCVDAKGALGAMSESSEVIMSPVGLTILQAQIAYSGLLHFLAAEEPERCEKQST